MGNAKGKTYLCVMFVRKKKNRFGTTSVVVVSKSRGSFREVKSFGTAQSEEDVETLCESARRWIHTYGGHSTTQEMR